MTKIVLLKTTIVVYLISILIVSLVSFNKFSDVKLLSQDKFIHFLMYFGLAFLLSIRYNTFQFRAKYVLIIVLFSSIYGMLMEIGQEVFTTYRTFDLKDIAANTLGSAFGTFFAYFFKNFTKNFFFK